MCANEVDWSTLGSSDNKSQGKRNFLKFETGKLHLVRPIGTAVEFYKFFINNRSVVVNKENRDKAAEIISKHFGKEVQPNHRYAIYVIDRDDKSIKILEAGHSVFKAFAMWSKANNNLAPGSQASGDFGIQVTGEKLQRRYTASFMRPAPLTPEEVKSIKDAQGKGEIEPLAKVFIETPLDKIIDRLTNANSNGSDDSGMSAASVDSVEPADLTSPDDVMKW